MYLDLFADVKLHQPPRLLYLMTLSSCAMYNSLKKYDGQFFPVSKDPYEKVTYEKFYVNIKSYNVSIM